MFVIFSNKDFQSFPPLLLWSTAPPPLSASNDCVLPCEDEHNRLQVTSLQWSQFCSDRFQDSTLLAALEWGGGPGLLMQLTCTLAGLAVWGSEGEHCPFSLPTTSNTHLPLLPLLSLSLHVFHRLSHSAEADEEVGRLGGGGSAGAQKALCLGSLHMVSFKLAYWTHYGIIYFYI